MEYTNIVDTIVANENKRFKIVKGHVKRATNVSKNSAFSGHNYLELILEEHDETFNFLGNAALEPKQQVELYVQTNKEDRITLVRAYKEGFPVDYLSM
jgi:hypothetical protein